MTRSENLGVVASGAFGPTVLLLYLVGFLTADLSFAIIGFSFAVALVPGVVENQRKKIGWSKRSCIMTGNNLFSFTVIFLTLGLPLTAVSELVSAAMWTALFVQAIIYAKKPAAPPENKMPHCAVCHGPMLDAPGIGPFCPDKECGNADGPVCTEEDPALCRRKAMDEYDDIVVAASGGF